MGKVIKNIWRIICYPLMYMGVQNVIFIIFMFPYIIIFTMENINSGGYSRYMSPEEITQKVLSRINITLTLIISIVVTFLILFLILRKEWAKEKLLGFKKLKVHFIILCVLLGIVFNFFINGAITLFFEYTQLPVPEQSIDIMFGNNIILELIGIALLGPFLEEVIFRGIIQKRLLKMMKVPGAIILQAFIFGLIHLNILQSSYAFVIGIVLGLVYLWSDSIWPAVAVHVLFNGTSVIMSHIPGEIDLDLTYFIIITAVALAISVFIMAVLYKRKIIKKVAYNRWAF